VFLAEPRLNSGEIVVRTIGNDLLMDYTVGVVVIDLPDDRN
jgi:hypothetical protein